MKTEDTKVYIKCMEKVKERIAVIRWLNGEKPPLAGNTMLTTELTFVQFRKILELIAFASLTSNKEKYAEARADFGSEWNAKKILKTVEKLNPHFYPIPLKEPKTLPDGKKFFDRPTDGFLTQADFERLYQAASEIIHMRNPFSSKDPLTKTDYPVEQYTMRIQKLLARHLIRMVGGKTVYVVTIPGGDAKIQMLRAEANN